MAWPVSEGTMRILLEKEDFCENVLNLTNCYFCIMSQLMRNCIDINRCRVKNVLADHDTHCQEHVLLRGNSHVRGKVSRIFIHGEDSIGIFTSDILEADLKSVYFMLPPVGKV